MRRIVGLAAVVLVLAWGQVAQAAPIMADVTDCVSSAIRLSNNCTVEPEGGPVALNPLGFTLDVDWMRQRVELLGGSDARPGW